MRILLPVHHFPPTHSAGAELYTLRLAQSLQAKGHEVEVVAIEAIDKGSADEIIARQDLYEGLLVWRLSFDLNAAPERHIWNFDNPLLGNWFRTHLRERPPDIVHFQAGYLLGIAPIREVYTQGIPMVLTLHDYWFLCPRHTLLQSDGALCINIPENPSACAWCHVAGNNRQQLVNRLTLGAWEMLAKQVVLRKETEAQILRRAELKQAIQYPNLLIAPSRFMEGQIRRLAEDQQIVYLPYGIDLMQEEPQHSETSEGPIRVGYMGQVAHHKGVDFLIEAWRHIEGDQPRELHIYGGSEEHFEKRLHHLAGDDGTIFFHGRFPYNQRSEILQTLDLCVVPSIWYENRPFSIAEALDMGVPVITARLGGMEEMVQDGVDGLHFAPGSAQDLARKIEMCVNDSALLHRLKSGAMTHHSSSVDEEVDQLLAIYAEVVASGGGASHDG